eukprot:GHVP01067404.1.p1 GENE.GHVP01067404.1~~GHVP01067404.1.p1  ORF type:complete len:232 (+),score=36.83 GHVP01067404.1:262-957(+)
MPSVEAYHVGEEEFTFGLTDEEKRAILLHLKRVNNLDKTNPVKTILFYGFCKFWLSEPNENVQHSQFREIFLGAGYYKLLLTGGESGVIVSSKKAIRNTEKVAEALSKAETKPVLVSESYSKYVPNLNLQSLVCQNVGPLLVPPFGQIPRYVCERFDLEDKAGGDSVVVLRNRKKSFSCCFVKKTEFFLEVPKKSQDFKAIIEKIKNFEANSNLKRPSSEPSNSVPRKKSK